MSRTIFLIWMLFFIGLFFSCTPKIHKNGFTKILNDNWKMQSSIQVSVNGDRLSQSDFQTENWYPVQVPSTVLAALVADEQYTNIYSGENLAAIPTDQFNHSWWYRTPFDLPDLTRGNRTRLRFEGINYRANIWFNGRKVAEADTILGAFRVFELDITHLIRKQSNVLAVEVFPPQPGDFSIGFVDWNPAPPDKNMGIWRDVKIVSSGSVAIENPFVSTKVNLQGKTNADVFVDAILYNSSDKEISGYLRGQIGDKQFEWPLTISADERFSLHLDSKMIPELHLKDPKLWWPIHLGDPNLYDMNLQFVADNLILDEQQITFGVRKIESYFNAAGHRGFKINGNNVLIRGAGWVDDLLLADTPEKTEAQILYVKHMNLNTIRLEGFWGKDQTLYDLCDRHGIMIMAGWSCQWEWEDYLGKACDQFGGITTEDDIKLISKSWEDQIQFFRNHPSVIAWFGGSDMLPRPALEKQYLTALKNQDTTRVYLAAAANLKSELSGRTGVKMNGPYDYVPPVYWYEDTSNGGAYGFNTETGPGPQPPPLSSLKRMIPSEQLWPINKVWEYHCGRNEFNTLNRYKNALDKRYGPSIDAADFTRTAQMANYEAIRPMYEAFAAHKFNSTGVIQWMLNSAWPEMYWQLYDYYLMPNGAFYGARKANAPMQLIYDYDKEEIFLNNDFLQDQKELFARIQIYNKDSRLLLEDTLSLQAKANSVQKIFSVPKVSGNEGIWFLDLTLKQKDKTVARNFYWLSQKKDKLDYSKSTWFVTPQKQFSNFKGLRSLAETQVTYKIKKHIGSGFDKIQVKCENSGKYIAFGVEMILNDANGNQILPVFWDDNYFSLLPGEQRTITVSYSTDVNSEQIQVKGWNFKAAQKE